MTFESKGAGGGSPKALILWLLKHWRPLAGSTVGAAALAAAISLLIPRSYDASTVLRPITIEDSDVLLQGSLSNPFGSVAGSLLGGQRQADDATIAIAVMQSMSFVRQFIRSANLMPELYPDDWDASAHRWKGVPPPLDSTAIQRFVDRLTILEEQDGLIDVDLRWSSPARAEQVETMFIAATNGKRRAMTLSRAKANLNYLENRLQHETTQEMRMKIADLAGKQLAEIMISNGPGDYALEVVSPPFSPQFPVAPPRKLIAIMGAIIGFMIAAIYLLCAQAWKKSS